MRLRGAESKVGGSHPPQGKEWRLLCSGSALLGKFSSGGLRNGGSCNGKAMLLFGSVVALCLIVTHQASPVEAGGTVSPKWPGPTAFFPEEWKPVKSRMGKCLDELFGKELPALTAAVGTIQRTCFIVPNLEGPNSLKNLLARLRFDSPECRRFNEKRYQSVLWNEVLVSMAARGAFSDFSGCKKAGGNWELSKDPQGLMLLTLFWDYALTILKRPRISRIFSFLSGSRITRAIRNFFVFSFPAKFKKLLRDTRWQPRESLIDDEAERGAKDLYAESCRMVKAPNLGRLFVDRVRTYASADEGDDFYQDY